MQYTDKTHITEPDSDVTKIHFLVHVRSLAVLIFKTGTWFVSLLSIIQLSNGAMVGFQPGLWDQGVVPAVHVIYPGPLVLHPATASYPLVGESSQVGFQPMDAPRYDIHKHIHVHMRARSQAATLSSFRHLIDRRDKQGLEQIESDNKQIKRRIDDLMRRLEALKGIKIGELHNQKRIDMDRLRVIFVQLMSTLYKEAYQAAPPDEKKDVQTKLEHLRFEEDKRIVAPEIVSPEELTRLFVSYAEKVNEIVRLAIAKPKALRGPNTRVRDQDVTGTRDVPLRKRKSEIPETVTEEESDEDREHQSELPVKKLRIATEDELDGGAVEVKVAPKKKIEMDSDDHDANGIPKSKPSLIKSTIKVEEPQKVSTSGDDDDSLLTREDSTSFGETDIGIHNDVEIDASGANTSGVEEVKEKSSRQPSSDDEEVKENSSEDHSEDGSDSSNSNPLSSVNGIPNVSSASKLKEPVETTAAVQGRVIENGTFVGNREADPLVIAIQDQVSI